MVQGNRSTGKLYIIHVYTYTITLLKEWTGLENKHFYVRNTVILQIFWKTDKEIPAVNLNNVLIKTLLEFMQSLKISMLVVDEINWWPRNAWSPPCFLLGFVWACPDFCDCPLVFWFLEELVLPFPACLAHTGQPPLE